MELPESWNAEAGRLPWERWLERFGLHPGGTWSLSWLALFVAGLGLAEFPSSVGVEIARAVLSTLFVALTWVGALAFAGRHAPVWILPAAVALGFVRGVLAAYVSPAAAHGLALAFEPAVVLMAATIVARASLLEPAQGLRVALVAALAAVALLELSDAWLGLSGRNHGVQSAWLAVAPATAGLEVWAMWLWIARREVRIERAEAAARVLESREAWLYDFFEKAPDMLLTLRPDTCEIERCNRRLSESLGRPRDRVEGSPLFDFLEPSQRTRARAMLLGQSWRRLRNLELRLVRRNGEAFDVLANFAVRPSPTTGAPELRAVLHEVTRLQRQTPPPRRPPTTSPPPT